MTPPARTGGDQDNFHECFLKKKTPVCVGRVAFAITLIFTKRTSHGIPMFFSLIFTTSSLIKKLSLSIPPEIFFIFIVFRSNFSKTYYNTNRVNLKVCSN